MADPMTISIRPIRTETDYDAALEEIASLMEADLDEGSVEDVRMDVLATLIEKYESQHFPMDAPDPLEAIKFRMEQSGFQRKDLEALLGGPARVSEILNRQRSLSIGMIRRLNDEWNIPAESLIRDIRNFKTA